MSSMQFYGGGELVPYTSRAGFEGLSPIDNIRAQFGQYGSLDTKRAYELVPVGVQGRPQTPSTDVLTLIRHHRRNELVYACVEKIAQAAIDPEIIVEEKKGKEWSPVEGHELRRLIMRPNPMDDSASFIGACLTSEHIAGVFYAEIVRDGAGRPAQLWPLDPAKMRPIPGKGKNGSPIVGYEWKEGSQKVEFKPEEVLVRRNRDLTSRFHGLAPLAVAVGAVDADTAMSDYVRAFFNNGGVPSGVLTFKNRTLSRTEMEQKRQAWMMRYGRGGVGERGIAVLDQNAEYQRIGTSMHELESDSLRGQLEARICMIFGVPPLLVGAYVGLMHVNQRASAKEAQQDFWMNKMSPTFKALRTFLTWNLLTQFVDEEQVRAEKIRVGWDMSNVIALQEDEDKRHDRARKNFQAGGITQNEYRAKIGQEPDPDGDFYIIPSSMNPSTGEVLMARAQAKPKPAPDEPTDEESADDGDDAQGKALSFEELKEKWAQLDVVITSKVFMLGDLALARAPRGVESAIDLKAIATGPKQAAADIKEVLLSLRKKLITEAVKDLAERDPADSHMLILTPDPKVYKSVRRQLERAYTTGRRLISEEAAQQGAKRSRVMTEGKAAADDEEDDLYLDTVGDATISKVVNDVQGKAALILATLAVLDVAIDERRSRIQQTLEDGSTVYVEQSAAAAANAAMNAGRDAEIEARADDIRSVLYSAILDVNTCESCEAADGQEAVDVSDLPSAPNEECLGGDKCRCFHVAVFSSESSGG